MHTPWLEHKRIVIIGGTSGIGLSAARAFIAEGAKVVVVGLDQESVKASSIALKENGMALQGDATHVDTASQAIQTCLQKYGGFDGLYHVAGGSGRKHGDGPLHELTLDGWNHTFQ